MLNLDSRTKSKLLWVGTLLVPAIAVQVVRFMMGGGPAAANAATAPAPVAPPIVAPTVEVAKALSPEQDKAVSWLHTRKQTLGLRSPMDYPDVVAEPPAPETPVAVRSNPGSTDTSPQATSRAPGSMTITALMSGSSADSSIVSINHHLYRVGEEIVQGWKILSIDPHNRTATIAGPDGQSLNLTLTIAEN